MKSSSIGGIVIGVGAFCLGYGANGSMSGFDLYMFSFGVIVTLLVIAQYYNGDYSDHPRPKIRIRAVVQSDTVDKDESEGGDEDEAKG